MEMSTPSYRATASAGASQGSCGPGNPTNRKKGASRSYSSIQRTACAPCQVSTYASSGMGIGVESHIGTHLVAFCPSSLSPW